MKRWLFFIFLVLMLHPGFAKAESKKVLIVHSYHHGLEWTDNVNKGLKTAFQQHGDEVDLFFEYLDGKRNQGEPYYKELTDLFRLKQIHHKFDLIIVSDNIALDFVLNLRKELFQDLPIVFCGINNFQSVLLEGHANITGIIEDNDFKENINLIQRLHPHVNHVVIINDNKTTTAIENKKKISRIIDSRDSSLKFTFWENYSKAKIKHELKNLQSNEAVLLLTYNIDGNGEYLSYLDNKKLIPENYHIPVYSAWKFFLSGYVIGGKVISGEDQGFLAGISAVKVLDGVLADNIPIHTTDLSRFIFRYDLMEKYGIDEEDLPPNSEFLNKPDSFYKINKRYIIVGIVFIVVAVIIILILSNAIIRRKRAEKELLLRKKRLEISYKWQKLISEIVIKLNATNDFTKVIDVILKQINTYYSFGKVSLYNFDDTESIYNVIGSEVSNQYAIAELNEGEYHKLTRIIDTLKEEGKFISENLENLTSSEKKFYRKRRIGALALFPIRIGDHFLGMAAFVQAESFHWADSQIDEMTTIVNLIANAWERNIQMNRHLEAKEKLLKANQVLEKASRLASVGVMASGITHEINQPLNALKVTVDGILYWEKRHKDIMPEFVSNKLSILLKGIDKISEVIQHMRQYWIAPSKSEAAEVIDLKVAVLNAYSLLYRQIEDHGIQCEVLMPEKQTWIKGSFIQIEQIVINLVVNAIQELDNVTGREKQLIIMVKYKKNTAQLSVIDNASGIDTSIGEKLFDPFFSTKQEQKGSGLGLAIVKAFVEKLQGKIEYRNNPDFGATFTVTLQTSMKN